MLLYLLRDGQQRSNNGRQIERCEDRKGVSYCEERIASDRYRLRRWSSYARRRSEHLGELAVFVEAKGYVDARCCKKLGRSRCCALCGLVAYSATERIDCIGCSVRAEVERGDQESGF